MDFETYRMDAMRTLRVATADDNDLLAYGALGLAGETGEVLEPIKKFLYHHKELDDEALSLELGDVLWHVAAIATARHLNLTIIAHLNLLKLAQRYPEAQQ